MDDGEIHGAMLAAVIDQRLLPGTRLPEAELCDVFDVPRRNVERVLVRLAAEGVVTLERNRGASISRPTAQDARDIFALRGVVEREVVRLVCGAVTPEMRSDLEASLAAEEAGRGPPEGRDRIRRSGEFHVVLAEHCGNAEIRTLVKRLVARTSLVTQLYGNDRALNCWHHEHVRLLELLVEGRREEADALMLSHLRSIEGDLRPLELDTPKPDLSAALGGAK
jgi:DNA-binding GntR family transcriptional regulator